ncbi:MAG: glycoside hydrolase family protein [Bacteroidales bacterium]
MQNTGGEEMTLKQLLTKHEGRKNKPYKDTKGLATIGIGHNIDAKGLPDDIEAFLEANGYITDEMIDRLYEMDISDAITDAIRLYPALKSFSEPRIFALIDFVFNVGYKTASTFKNTNKAINEERWDDAADGLLASKYARQVGRRARDVAEMLRDG